MSLLARLVLALMLAFTPRGATLSRMEAPAGTQGARWEPCWRGGFDRFGDRKHFPCKPFVTGVAPVGAWVVMETNSARAERLLPAAVELAGVAQREREFWPWGDARDFAIALTTAAGWSTGFREDIQNGRARGPDGETCFADATYETAVRWSDPDVAARPKGVLLAGLVGPEPEALRRCFTILARGLANARRAAQWMCPVQRTKQPLLESAFAIYGTGNRCFTGGALAWAEKRRYSTYSKWVKREVAVFPDWYRAAAEASS